METRTPPTTLTGDACRRLERIIRDDLEHALIHDRIALEGRVCETCDTKGCHRPATWEIECRGAGYPAASSTRVTSIARIRRSYRRRTRSAGG